MRSFDLDREISFATERHRLDLNWTKSQNAKSMEFLLKIDSIPNLRKCNSGHFVLRVTYTTSTRHGIIRFLHWRYMNIIEAIQSTRLVALETSKTHWLFVSFECDLSRVRIFHMLVVWFTCIVFVSRQSWPISRMIWIVKNKGTHISENKTAKGKTANLG